MRNFLIVGKTGVGKSSFINATFGEDIAETSDFEACTKIAKYYAKNTPFGEVSLIDTPGLAEEDENYDRKYLSLINSCIKQQDIYTTLYVTRLDDPRFRPDDKRTLKRLTEELGTVFWNKIILVFTFASFVSYDLIDEHTTIKSNQIAEYLASIIPDNSFNGFSQIWITDNVVSNWTSEGVSGLSLMME